MELFKVKFWVNLMLVIATTYVFTWYLLTPSSNQCQMTFMMEPPKFIPVPIDDVIDHRDEALSYPEIAIGGSKQKHADYKLYMYSEFGFPQASNIRRDLKDSMPVLFVPGNAGSYQQVRSLASTCIRHQLQSLDAFKFIFYTIDFRGELSGISGQLIEDQTIFVQRSLEQISKNHPSETNGIILIGHSVGGFISKVLFTMPSFEPSSVPLLISLASPLTGSYLRFDEKMRKLYARANDHWSNRSTRSNDTVAISISGGKSDRLVPMHLSMDEHYDLSLTTSSIKEVWLSMDHVSITWCKELMHKLSRLLSALMDKKQTRLISNREATMSIIKRELLINSTLSQRVDNVIIKEWKSMRSYKIIEFMDYYSESRSQLGENMILLKMKHPLKSEILIIIDYIDTLKENGVFGCSDIIFGSTNEQFTCVGRLDLMSLAQIIPSRRFEPKRLALRLNPDDSNHMNYIVFDFLSMKGYSNRLEYKLPEMLTVQTISTSAVNRMIYIPTVLEYFYKKILFIDDFHYDISSQQAFPLIYIRYIIKNLNQKTQIYSINFKSHSCMSDKHPYGATVVFLQHGYVTESFYPSPTSKDLISIDIKVTSQQSISLGRQAKLEHDESYLDFYIDGSCKNSFDIQLDLLALVIDVIQKQLGKIITCTSLFAYLSAATNMFKSKRERRSGEINFLFHDNSPLIQVLTFIIVYASSDHFLNARTKNQNEDYLDQFSSIILIFILSHGMLAFLDYFIKRVIDLAIIINNGQLLLRQKLSKDEHKNNQSKGDSVTMNGTHSTNLGRSLKANFDWLLITIAILGGFLFSPAVISMFALFIVVQLSLSLNIAESRETDITQASEGNKHCPINNVQRSLNSNCSHVHDLVSSVAVLNVLALIPTIPSALIRISSNKLTSIDSIFIPVHGDLSSLVTAFSLISVKVICEIIETELTYRSTSRNAQNSSTSPRRQFKGVLYSFLRLFSSKNLHLLTLASIVMIESNIHHLTLAFTILTAWLSGSLLSEFDLDALENRKCENK